MSEWPPAPWDHENHARHVVIATGYDDATGGGLVGLRVVGAEWAVLSADEASELALRIVKAVREGGEAGRGHLS